MRIIGVVTTSRADYGIYRPLLQRIQQDSALDLRLFVSGTHLLTDFGLTVRQIEEDGFPIAERIAIPLTSDLPVGISTAMGETISGFARAYTRIRSDILVVLGDRYEMFAAAAAAVPFNIPLAHIAGGAVTEGAMDDAFRHALTKLCHLHFAETALYARRILQMGEEPWRVTVTGALGLDNLHEVSLLTPDEFMARFDIPLTPAPLFVTFHPLTRDYTRTAYYFTEVLAALRKFAMPLIFTYPNADTSGRLLIRMIEEFVAEVPNAYAISSLGTRAISPCRHMRGQ